MNKVELDPQIYSKMQTNSPFRTYKKTILGQVAIIIIDPFNGDVTGTILRGDPKKNDEGCFIDLWSEREDLFFRRQNRRHIELGYIIPFKRVEEERVPTVNEMTDEEMVELLNARGFLKLQSVLNKMDSIAPVYRMLQIAEDLGKQSKLVDAIKKRLNELQTIEVKEDNSTEE